MLEIHYKWTSHNPKCIRVLVQLLCWLISINHSYHHHTRGIHKRIKVVHNYFISVIKTPFCPVRILVYDGWVQCLWTPVYNVSRYASKDPCVWLKVEKAFFKTFVSWVGDKRARNFHTIGGWDNLLQDVCKLGGGPIKNHIMDGRRGTFCTMMVGKQLYDCATNHTTKQLNLDFICSMVCMFQSNLT